MTAWHIYSPIFLTLPDLSLTIPLPPSLCFSHVHFLYPGLDPGSPYPPLPSTSSTTPLPSPQIFSYAGSSSNMTSSAKPPHITKLNRIPQISVPNPGHSDSIGHIHPHHTAHKLKRFKSSRQPSQRYNPVLPVWVRGTGFYQKPGKTFLGPENAEMEILEITVNVWPWGTVWI